MEAADYRPLFVDDERAQIELASALNVACDNVYSRGTYDASSTNHDRSTD